MCCGADFASTFDLSTDPSLLADSELVSETRLTYRWMGKVMSMEYPVRVKCGMVFGVCPRFLRKAGPGRTWRVKWIVEGGLGGAAVLVRI